MAAINAMVIVKNNNVDVALKIFKRKLKEAGTMEKLNEKLEYEKKSARKRRIRLASLRKQRFETLQRTE